MKRITASKKKLEVMDDVSMVEQLKHPVYITEGSYTNIRIGFDFQLKIEVLAYVITYFEIKEKIQQLILQEENDVLDFTKN